jgi:hypothetical protein
MIRENMNKPVYYLCILIYTKTCSPINVYVNITYFREDKQFQVEGV